MSYWYKRFKKEIMDMDGNIIIKPFAYNFDRVFYRTPAKDAFIMEIPRNMTEMNYYDFLFRERLSKQSFYEDYEDEIDNVMITSNQIPGYYACIEDFKTLLYLFRNSSDFYYTTINNTNGILE